MPGSVQQNNAIQILSMEEKHVEGVHAIFEECFTMEKWSLKSIAAELTNPMAVTLVAVDTDTGRVVGFINVHHVMGEGDLNDIAVTEPYRRQGIASRLLEAQLHRGKKEKIASYTLEVRESNERAIRFYESFGFQRIGMRKNYYSKPIEDAFLYQLQLEE